MLTVTMIVMMIVVESDADNGGESDADSGGESDGDSGGERDGESYGNSGEG